MNEETSLNPADIARDRIAAVNEALLISGLRQHELAEEAIKLNEQLQKEIGENKAAQRTLAEQARLLNLSNDAIIVHDINNRITYWNHGAQQLFGWTTEEVLGRDLHTLLQTEFEQPLPDLVAKLRRENRLIGEVIQTARDGRRLHLLCRWSLDHQPEGQPGAILTTSTDITNRKRAEEEIKKAMEEISRSSRAKDDFLSALSHELRTPLTPVLIAVAELERAPALPPEMREQLAMMRRNIELEARLIDDLLDLTNISRGKLSITPVSTDIHTLLEYTVDIVRGKDSGKQAHIALDLEAERHHTLADATRLQQVFWNLLKNALKFTSSVGSIIVRTSNDAAGKIDISIEDSGLGISAATLPRIFNAFEQGDVSGQHRFGGLGLGLAISQAIVQAHGGSIVGTSAGLGRGATFTVVLDTVTQYSSGEQDGAQLETPARRVLHILIVEDHEDTRMVFESLLKSSGHRVSAVGTATAALAIFAAEHFDVVVSDLGLPDISGLELMRQIQQIRKVPAIALSGYGMEEDLRQSREAGFFAHLTKPINIDQLWLLFDEIPKEKD